jgi:excisionase family DNA binding protein
MAVPDALRRLAVSRRADSDEGSVFSISEAAELLQVERVTIDAWMESKRLLAWQAIGRGVVISSRQILRAGEVVPGIAQLLAVIPDAEAAWDFLSEESAFLDPESPVRPIEALREAKSIP